MSRAARARRIATAAVYGGGSIGGLVAAGFGVVYGETKLARRRIKPRGIDPPLADGVWLAPGVPEARNPLRVAVLGDSSAAGYGLDDAAETPAAVLARGLSALSHRPVSVRCEAVVGAQSSDLDEQVSKILASDEPELVFIMIGANDVTHRIRAAQAVRHLAGAVTTLREAGCEVVVGTCPDLGTIRPIAQPLRFVARRLSRTLAAAQTIAVVEAGGRTVSLGDILGPRFARERDLFGEDAFHPSARGYAAAIDVALPSVAAALGLPTHTESASAFTTRRARPIAKAAARAVKHPGTEVAGAEVAGQSRGSRGRWARLLRRSSAPTGTAEPTGSAEPTSTAEPTGSAEPTSTAEPTGTAGPTGSADAPA